MRPHLWLIQFIGLIVPRRLRADWRQEWEAELRCRETLLADWDKLEMEIWKPVMEARVAAGNLAAWSSYSLSLPGGTGHAYNAVTVDAFASWDAMFKPTGLADALKKVHPNLTPEEFNERTAKARTIVNREVYRVQVALQ